MAKKPRKPKKFKMDGLLLTRAIGLLADDAAERVGALLREPKREGHAWCDAMNKAMLDRLAWDHLQMLLNDNDRMLDLIDESSMEYEF